MTDYNYYITQFEGRKITKEEEFSSLVDKAYRYVKNIVTDKAKDSDINDAICAVCEFLSENDTDSLVKSESVDGVSINYENSDLHKKLYNIIKLYTPSRLLYRGLN